MLYQRSLAIEQRLRTILRLIRAGRYSTPQLAAEIGVSIPTISRYVTALRARGYDIRAEKRAGGWRYVLAGKTAGPRPPKTAPFVQPLA
jgi:predicted DNA-binding transcriptional regulator YafY